MAVGDVPDAPLSTVEVFVSQATAQLTLTLLLLKDLQRDLGEHRVGGVDAVGIELDFVHVAIIGPLRRTWHRFWPSSRIVHRRPSEALQRSSPGTPAGGGA